MAGRLIIVRAGHVVAARGTDQFAAARFQLLRADGTIPRRIFGTSDGTLTNLRRRSGLSCGLRRLGLNLSLLPLRGAFHGGMVIAQWEEEGIRNSKNWAVDSGPEIYSSGLTARIEGVTREDL